MTYPIDISGSPHYDTSAVEIGRGYMLVLPRPGKKIQGREFISAQRYLEKAIKDIGNITTKDGAIVEGCELIVNIADDPITVSVGAGKVYINGRVWEIDALPLTNIGNQPAANLAPINIDVVVEEEIITDANDTSLRSPAENYSNFNQPGAYRLKATAHFEINSESGVTVYRLIKGVPLKLPTSSAFTELEPILARRTYDESDNYLVTGLNLIAEGNDETAFESQDYLIPAPNDDFPEGTVTWGPSTHPYGPNWTNRFTSDGGALEFTADHVGKRLVLLTTGTNTDHPFTGAYDIVDVINAHEIEISGELTGTPSGGGSETGIAWGIKEYPQSLQVTVTNGKAYVIGFEVSKPISTQLSVPKALSGREIINEPQSLTFRTFEYAFREQPFIELTSEGLTANVLIGLGMPAEMSGTARNEAGPTRSSTIDPNNGFSYDDLYNVTGLPIVDVIAVASSTSTWTWHLDPVDPDYPGVFSGGVLYSEAGALGASGWYQQGNRLYWGSSGLKPSTGQAYRVVCVVSSTLARGNDFRIKSNASAMLYQLPGASTSPETSNNLFFPQTEFDLTSEPQFVFDVDGTRIAIDFRVAGNLGENLIPESSPGVADLTAVPINNIVNVINKVGNAAGQPNIATVQYETVYDAEPTRGFIVLKSNTTGSASTLEIIQGNNTLGFPTGISATGSSNPSDVISFGGHRAVSRIQQNSTVFADYSFGLYRKDLVTLDKSGNVSVLPGNPEIKAKLLAREGFVSTMSLGSMEIAPKSTSIVVTNYDNLRTTMPELRKLINRVDKLEYDIAILDLDREAIGNENPSNLSGVFSDGFVGFSKAQVDYTSNTDIDVESGDTVSVDYDASIDLVDKEVSLPFAEIDTPLTVNTSASSSNISFSGDSLVVLPVTSQTDVVTQSQVTEFLRLNQYSLYGHDPKIRLTPFFENYIYARSLDIDPKPFVQEQEVKPHHVTSWVKPRISTDRTESQSGRFRTRTGASTGLNDRASADNVTIETSDKLIEESVPFIRPREITVHGRGFIPNETGLVLTFDGQVIPWNSILDNAAVNGTLVGGKVTVNAKGRFAAKVTLPVVKRRPAHTVQVVGDMGDSATATTNYRGWFWRRKPPEDVYHSEKRGFMPRHPVVRNYFTGVAQTFQLTSDTILSAISLHLKSLDSTYPMTVQIRNVENNVPGKISYAEEVLSPLSGGVTDPPELSTDTDISEDGATVKKITFKEPVFIRANQDYAICLSSKGTGYQVGIARVGKVDLATGQIVSQQPTTVGKLFTSPSASEWIAQDDADLAFKLHANVFSTSPATVVFNQVTPATAFTQVLLAAEHAEMNGTIVEWSYSVNGGSTFSPITPFAVTDVGSNPNTTYSSIIVKAVISTTDTTQAPILMKDSISIMTRRLATSGEYITKRTQLSEGNEYNEIRQTIKVKQGTGGTVNVYFGYQDADGIMNWVKSELDTNQVPDSLSDGYTRIYYRTNAPLMVCPDVTSPAKLVGTVTPSIIDPTFDTTGDNTLTVRITYWTVGDTVDTIDIPITLTNSAALAASQVVDEINAETEAIVDALEITTFDIASLDELNHIVLTHPQSMGQERNKLQIIGTCSSIGFGTLNQVDYGGTILGSAVAAGVGEVATGGTNNLTGSTTYHYAVIATDGTGYSTIPSQVDFIPVTTDGSNKTAKLLFNQGKTSIDPSASSIVIYRGTGSVGSLTIKRLEEIDATIFGGVYYDDGSINPITSVSLPETEVEAQLKLSNFTGRLSLATTSAGNSPKVKDFTNVFVRA